MSTEQQKMRQEFEATLKTFAAYNADDVIVWRTRCHTVEQAYRKWQFAAPKVYFAARVKEVKS